MSAISVFGLGYVGAVSLACLAESGHTMMGVDVNPTKVALIAEGCSPIIEAGLEESLKKGVLSGRIQATTDTHKAILGSDLSLICVGTPSQPNGNLDLTYVQRVCEQIGRVLAHKPAPHVVVMRSTILPGTMEDVVIPTLERFSGKTAGRDFGVCFNPEFLREGSSIADFYDPPFTIIGAAGDDETQAAARVQALYESLPSPVKIVPYRVAEMVKYANNAFHALKVTFANEIGDICKRNGMDSHQVMDIFCLDTKLNLSPYYLKPGFAFGGSCLPKDLRALLYHGRRLDLQLPVLEAILPSNNQQVELAYQMIARTGRKRVGVLGFSFKAGTDDLRESPIVELIERLIGKGYQVCVYDRNVSLAALQGANRAYIEQEIPHIACLTAHTMNEVLEKSEVIVVGNRAAEFVEVLPHLGHDQILIDLVRITDAPQNGNYQGICW